MVLDLDSVNQCAQWQNGWRPRAPQEEDPRRDERLQPALDAVGRMAPHAINWLTGTLRTADLVSETILITDAQLLDGVFFQALGVERVHEILGRSDLDPPTFTILGRAVSLEESLRRLVVGPGDLGHFEYSVFSALGADTRDLRARLQAVDPTGVDQAAPGEVARQAIAAFAEAGAGNDDLRARLLAGWEAWIEAEATGRIGFEQYRTAGAGFAVVADKWWTPVLNTGPGRDLAAVLREVSKRSDALRAIAESGLPADLEEHVRAWYETVYIDYVATNNEADWLDLAGGRFSDVTVRRRRSSGKASIPLRGSAPMHLGQMPLATYQQLRYRSREAQAAWRTEPSARAMDRIAYAIENTAAAPDLTRDRRALLTGLSLTLLLSVGLVLLTSVLGTIPVGLWLIPLLTIGLTVAVETVKLMGPIRAVRRSTLRSIIHLGE